MQTRSARADAHSLRIGDVFLGKYQVLEVMGSGGHGCVYGAQSLFMGREVAIKVLDGARGLTDEARARGQREAIALGRLGRHPGIVEVYDAGIDVDGRLYLVMERLEGCTLHQHLREHGALDVATGLRIIIALCDALEFARQAKVVHRDIKPTNIFITPDGSPKLVDFGVAKITDAPGFQTAPKVVVGTALYVSPEQIRAQPATHRSDLYALGLVAYQIFTREHPLLLAAPDADRRDLRVIWALHLHADPPRLDRVIAGFPEYVARLVHTAMSREPAKRYASAAEFGKRARETLQRYEADRARSAKGAAPEVGRTPEVGRSMPASASPVAPEPVAREPAAPEPVALDPAALEPAAPGRTVAQPERKLEPGTTTPVHTVGDGTLERAVGTPSTEQFLPPTPPESSEDLSLPSSSAQSRNLFYAREAPRAAAPVAAPAVAAWPALVDGPALVQSSLWTPPSAAQPVAHGAQPWSKGSLAGLVLGVGALLGLSVLFLQPSSAAPPAVPRVARTAQPAQPAQPVVATVDPPALAPEPVANTAPQQVAFSAKERPRPPARRTVRRSPAPTTASAELARPDVAAETPAHWTDAIVPPEAPAATADDRALPPADRQPEPWLN